MRSKYGEDEVPSYWRRASWAQPCPRFPQNGVSRRGTRDIYRSGQSEGVAAIYAAASSTVTVTGLDGSRILAAKRWKARRWQLHRLLRRRSTLRPPLGQRLRRVRRYLRDVRPIKSATQATYATAFSRPTPYVAGKPRRCLLYTSTRKIQAL